MISEQKAKQRNQTNDIDKWKNIWSISQRTFCSLIKSWILNEIWVRYDYHCKKRILSVCLLCWVTDMHLQQLHNSKARKISNFNVTYLIIHLWLLFICFINITKLTDFTAKGISFPKLFRRKVEYQVTLFSFICNKYANTPTSALLTIHGKYFNKLTLYHLIKKRKRGVRGSVEEAKMFIICRRETCDLRQQCLGTCYNFLFPFSLFPVNLRQKRSF